MLNLTNSFATDTVRTYLFGESYGDLEEKNEHLSASGVVDSFVAVGRFWYLPSWTFQTLEWLIAKMGHERRAARSMKTVATFVGAVSATDLDARTLARAAQCAA